DQPNNAVSLKVLHQGEVAATSGTSGVVYGIVDQALYDPQSRVNSFAHVNYEDHFDRIGMLLCINGAGIQYSWIKHQIARAKTSYHDMDRMASTVPIGAEGICVLPFGNGAERIFEDRNLGAHVFNLRFNRHSRAHLYRAALEGVAFAFVYGIQILKEMGLTVDVIRVGNDNMFQSTIFAQTIATLIGSHIEVVDTTGAIGAARASGVGGGIYKNLEEALASVRPTALHEPRLNFPMCSQAYSYWKASLDKILAPKESQMKNINFIKSRNEQLNQELVAKSKIVASQSIDLANHKRIISKVHHKVNELLQSGMKGERLQIELKAIEKTLQLSFETDSSWAAFEEHFDLLNDDFVKHLKAKFPALSIEELKLCMLLKLKLRTKEIAAQLNISTRGVETKRYRLRKKMNVPSGLRIIDFLDKVK
ncbi:MAG: FGGY-family carbohydrate kinase, partial [Bacteroidota bacterium]